MSNEPRIVGPFRVSSELEARIGQRCNYTIQDMGGDLRKLVAQRLKHARQDAGLTQHGVNSALPHVSHQRLGHYETGRNWIPLDIALDLAKLYGTTPGYLLGLENDSTDAQNKIESQLLEGFRNLDDAGRTAVLSMMEALQSK